MDLNIADPNTYLILTAMFALLGILWFFRPYLLTGHLSNKWTLLIHLVPCFCFFVLWCLVATGSLDMAKVDRCFQRQTAFTAKVGCFFKR